jgi:hypothetical protein
MFIHFMGRKDEPWASNYEHALAGMIDALKDLENVLADTRENLLTDYRPKERIRTSSTELSESQRREGTEERGAAGPPSYGQQARSRSSCRSRFRAIACRGFRQNGQQSGCKAPAQRV